MAESRRGEQPAVGGLNSVHAAFNANLAPPENRLGSHVFSPL